MSVTLVIAHRGVSDAVPENSVAAFARAAHLGVDGVELDVRRARGGELVVHHDPVLPDGRVIVETEGGDLPDVVPSLCDALDACVGMFVNVEIKNIAGEPDYDPDAGLVADVVNELRRRNEPRRWLVSSFDVPTLARTRRAFAGVRTALLTYDAPDAAVAAALELGCVAVHPWDGSVDAAGLRAAHTAGLAVSPWTVNDPWRIAELIGWGVDGICTDVPAAALAVRASARPS